MAGLQAGEEEGGEVLSADELQEGGREQPQFWEPVQGDEAKPAGVLECAAALHL